MAMATFGLTLALVSTSSAAEVANNSSSNFPRGFSGDFPFLVPPAPMSLQHQRNDNCVQEHIVEEAGFRHHCRRGRGAAASGRIRLCCRRTLSATSPDACLAGLPPRLYDHSSEASDCLIKLLIRHLSVLLRTEICCPVRLCIKRK